MGRRKLKIGARIRTVVEDGDFEVIEAGCYVGDVEDGPDDDGYWTVILERNRTSTVTIALVESDLEVL